MVDDNEDYSFEDESTDVYGAIEHDSVDLEKQKKVRRLIMGVGVFLILFAGYKLMGIIFPVKDGDAEQQNQTQQQSSSTEDSLQARLSSMQQKDSTTAHQISQIKLNQEAQEAKFKKQNQTIINLSKEIHSLAQAMMQQQKAMKELQTMVAGLDKPTKYAAKQAKPKVPLFINAISSSGRVYIESQNGSDFGTYKQGDTIPGYGIVRGVNVTNNTVTIQDPQGNYHKLGFAPGDQ